MLPVKAAMRPDIFSCSRALSSSASRRRTRTRMLRSSVRLIEPSCSTLGDRGTGLSAIARSRLRAAGSSVDLAVGIERTRHARLHAFLVLLLLDRILRRLDAGVLRCLTGLF